MHNPVPTLLFALSAMACTAAHAGVCSFEDARNQFAAFLGTEQLAGGAMLVGTPQGILAEQYFGTYDASTVVPVASASKLLSAVRILQVVDRGQVDLDAPVSTYLPVFTGEKASMTLRQMFSHTAGYGDDSGANIINDDTITLAQAVNFIACCRPLTTGYTVGGQFSYGGVSMHVGGRVAEIADGDWEQRWKSELGVPLGITTIDWQGLGPTFNYRIAGGAQSNLRDYGRVMQMIANGGRGNNHRLLRASTLALLQQDNIGDRPIAYAPNNAKPPIRYGVGSWLDTTGSGDAPTFLHSLGAFGYFPWFDFEQGLFGVFMIRATPGINEGSLPVYFNMLRSISAEINAGACTPVEFSDAIFASEFEPY